MKNVIVIFWCIIFGLPATSQKLSVTIEPKYIDSYVQQLMDSINEIPSIALVIVKNGKVVYKKAHGYADKEQKVKADERTLYYIASSTRSFTGLAAQILHYKKKLLLTKPFCDYLPKLVFPNSFAADSIAAFRLLNHVSGIENNFLTYRYAYSGDYTYHSLLELLSKFTVRSKEGMKFRYDNLGYNIYGLMLQHHLNKTWQQVLKEEIFNPAGMHSTFSSTSEMQKRKLTVASPYRAYGSNGFEKVSIKKDDATLHTAGGLYTNINDLSKWLLLQTGKGVINGHAILPAEIFTEQRANATMLAKAESPFTGDGTYALGLASAMYNNRTVYYHNGAFPGYAAHISFMPGESLGIAIVCNESNIGLSALDVLAKSIYHLFLDDTLISYKTQFAELVARHKKNIIENAKGYNERAQRKWQLTQPLTMYAGTYFHEGYGHLEFKVNNSELIAYNGLLQCKAEPFTVKESFRLEFIPGNGRVGQFVMNPENKITALRYNGVEFKRITEQH